MRLSIDKAPAIVSEFVHAHVVAKAPSGWQQFGLGFPAVQQMERSGGKVEFNGIIFGKGDLDALLEISRKYGA